MPKQGWIDFTDAHPDGHVVVALVPAEGRLRMDKARVESLRATLESLIEKLVPSATYATKIVPQGDTAEIYCVFEEEADARRMAEAVRARRMGPPHPGWASQWSFVLGGGQPRRSKLH